MSVFSQEKTTIRHLLEFLRQFPANMQWHRSTESLVIQGEDATNKLIAAYQRGIRNFKGSALAAVDLTELKLKGINLSRCHLGSALLMESDLRNSCFQYSDLVNAEFSESDLRKADFSHADLTDATLIGVDLRKANFRNACLKVADLTGADLVGADLTGADTTGAIFDEVRWYRHEEKAI
ncbi:pentapeptide repeat-containing protein [Acaryochloris sp. CCMEE 5410]|uniref:pentapeptide repeat-containing protein n=1 Tax=Acaryochloris sp. CCMEE 5410 TaxID=310037 RepID=UPI0002483A03|nr:pentapeptide repeat-containing protein [Acaryochloris sp. CCMEE 5410]KAI9129451.1 pentapeptide repeat-containing protein [Acaryochloris sp. CCMEE 5410]